MKTMLITGSGGFIGNNSVRFFESDYALLTPRSFELDLRNPHAVQTYFKTHDIDYIIHCSTVGGARGIQDAHSTVDDNLTMIQNLLAYKKTNTYMIAFGSGAMYGKHRNLYKIKEEELGRVIPHDLYGISKMHIAHHIAQRDDVAYLVIFACYGYDEKSSRFPTYAIVQNYQKQPIIINQNVVFDYLFIDDMLAILRLCIAHPPSIPILNITPTESISLVQIADIVNESSSFHSDILIENPILNNEYTGDNTLLRTIFPHFTFTDYTTGLDSLRKYIIQKICSATNHS